MAEHDFVDLHSFLFSFSFFCFLSPDPLPLSLNHYTHTCLITQPPAIFSFLPPLTNPIDGTKNFFPRFFSFMFSISFPCYVSLRRKQGENISSLNEMGLLYPSHKKNPIPKWFNLFKEFCFFAFQFFLWLF